MDPQIVRYDFEVFGKVQGVFFRKYTEKKAKELGLRGWVRNTDRNTVVGTIEGNRNRTEDMKLWLRNEGSPKSRIDNLEIKNETSISTYSFSKFTFRK